jgi:hypothetical protein
MDDALDTLAWSRFDSAREIERRIAIASHRAGPSHRTGRVIDSAGREEARRPIIDRVPPIDELIRIEPIYLGRLERQGIFTTGLLLEVTETPTRRQYLADQVDASPNDVLTWRDEAQMLNLAGFGPAEHRLLSQAGFEGLADILEVDLDAFRKRIARGADELKMEPPSDLTIEGWWDQAHTLAE